MEQLMGISFFNQCLLQDFSCLGPATAAGITAGRCPFELLHIANAFIHRIADV